MAFSLRMAKLELCTDATSRKKREFLAYILEIKVDSEEDVKGHGMGHNRRSSDVRAYVDFHVSLVVHVTPCFWGSCRNRDMESDDMRYTHFCPFLIRLQSLR